MEFEAILAAMPLFARCLYWLGVAVFLGGVGFGALELIYILEGRID